MAKRFRKGDTIVPRDVKDSRDWAAYALRVESHDEEALHTWPIGGGFHYKFDKEAQKTHDFVLVDKETATSPPYYRTLFTGDWVNGRELTPGWTTGVSWNGWATPLFEFEDALKVIEDYNNASNEVMAQYDPKRDAFVIDEGMGDDKYIVSAENISIRLPNGRTRKIKVYGIGFQSWTWEEAGETEEVE